MDAYSKKNKQTNQKTGLIITSEILKILFMASLHKNMQIIQFYLHIVKNELKIKYASQFKHNTETMYS